jgi:hypothetical protein
MLWMHAAALRTRQRAAELPHAVVDGRRLADRTASKTMRQL